MVEREQTEQNRTVARVNGELVGKAPRARGGNELHHNPRIQWLLNESRGEMGERGKSIDPTSGGGRDMSDNWPLIERLHDAQDAVVRWRSYNAVLVSLSPQTQREIRARYKVTEREHSEIRGLKAAFEDLATLAWHLCEDREAMRRTLSGGGEKGDKSVSRLRALTTTTNRRIHQEWLDAERFRLQAWVNK